jgi:ABC-type glycerol-3-phosphate transport system substrate-binding protein
LGYFTIQALNPSLRFQVSPVPHLPLGRKITVASYWVEGVSQKTKYQKEAMLFMKYLTKKETLQKMYSEASKTRPFGEIYPRVDMADSLKDNVFIYPFVAQAKDEVSTFMASDTYDNGLNEKSNTYLGNAVTSILDNTSPESALETLSAGIRKSAKVWTK